MEVLNNWHDLSGTASEFDMQEEVDKFIKLQEYRKWNPNGGNYGMGGYVKLPTIVLRELRVPEIGRISDHVLLINKNKVINVECKRNDIGGVIRQAKDHLRWCDYSIICIPPDGAYVATSYIEDIIKSGLGLWYWFRSIGVFEFIHPRFNRSKDKGLRTKVINRIVEIAEKPKN